MRQCSKVTLEWTLYDPYSCSSPLCNPMGPASTRLKRSRVALTRIRLLMHEIRRSTDLPYWIQPSVCLVSSKTHACRNLYRNTDP